MKAELWDRAEEIFNTALTLPQEARAPFLQRECNGETALLSEVQSLLDSFESHSGFLEEPVFELGLKAFNDPPHEDRSGSTIGPYQLEERIGVGGMGEVYRAVDTRLNRRVALKFLTNTLANNKDAKRQLIKEAQAVAMLDHPNICSVHSIEQTEDSQFIVMQFIDGQTLGDSIASHATTPDEFLSIARQILSAVAFAHSHGVIHRDLKPGNIMLTPDGTIKVLDFGLAKIIPQKSLLGGASTDDVSQFSQAGSIIGTVSYMSPEQLRGEKLDYRSDVFSVGVVLYELLSGKNPFKRDSQAETIAAVLASDPPPLSKTDVDFPKGLAGIVERCLAKNKDNRFHSVAELQVKLDDASLSGLSTRRRNKRAILAAAPILAILAIVLLGVSYLVDSPRQRTLAVLPISLDRVATEKEYLADGLTRSVIDKLSNLSDLSVKKEYYTAHFKGNPMRAEDAGKVLGVDAVFTGRIVDRDGTLMLVTSLIRTSDGFIIDVADEPIDESNLVALQEAVAARIIDKTSSKLTDEDRRKLVRNDTENPEAKRAYFVGRYYLERQDEGDLIRAELAFRNATALTPDYARAWAGLADAYSLMTVPGHKSPMSPDEAANRARSAANNATQLDDTLCEPDLSLGMIKLRYDWDWRGAESHFRKAISCDPEFPQARLALSNLQILNRDYAASIDEAEKAKQSSPFSPLPYLYIARTLYFQRSYEEMERVLSESLEKFPDHKRLRYVRSLQYLETGRLSEAAEILESIYQKDPLYGAAPLGLAYGRMGLKDRALEILNKLEEISKSNYVSSQERAIIYLGLGEIDTVFQHLNKACDEKFAAFPFVITDPIFDEIRSDKRFTELKACAKL